MKQFSLGNAWSSGVAFVSRDAANMAIIIIGIGVLAPAVLQFAIVGSATGMMNPAMMGQMATPGGAAALAGGFALAMLLGYILQMSSYFGAWRLGFGTGESIGGAIVFGLICAVLMIVAFVALFILMALIAQAASGLGLLLLVFLIPFLVLVAALYTVLVAAMAIVMFLVLLVALAFGSSMGASNPAFALTGAGGLGVLIGLALVALIFWLAVRFSCATSVMADRKTFNLATGMSESWRLTADNQWLIMGYLALIGVILCVGFFVFAMVLGASMMGGFSGGTVPQPGIGTALLGLLIGIPLAYLVVLVPAGVYRELSHEPAEKVFA